MREDKNNRDSVTLPISRKQYVTAKPYGYGRLITVFEPGGEHNIRKIELTDADAELIYEQLGRVLAK